MAPQSCKMVYTMCSFRHFRFVQRFSKQTLHAFRFEREHIHCVRGWQFKNLWAISKVLNQFSQNHFNYVGWSWMAKQTPSQTQFQSCLCAKISCNDSFRWMNNTLLSRIKMMTLIYARKKKRELLCQQVNSSSYKYSGKSLLINSSCQTE